MAAWDDQVGRSREVQAAGKGLKGRSEDVTAVDLASVGREDS
jgi:hypothetical protein